MALTISHRCQNIAPSPTLAIDARAKEMKAAGVDVIGFGAGEPDFPTPTYICDAAKEALDKGMTRYTPAAGTVALRQAICDKLERDNHLHYTPSDIIVSSGAKHSLYTIFQCILDPGDEVLIPTPCWVSYPEMVRMAGGVPVFIPSDERNNFIPTSHDIAARVTRRTKAIILTSPSNPNGSVWSREQLQFVADLAVSHPFYVVSDEIYEKLIYDGQKHVSIAELGEAIKNQTFVVNGMSKAYAMTGWRIGYACANARIAKVMANYVSHSTGSPVTMSQKASVQALTGPQEKIERMRRAFEERRDYIVQRMNAIPGVSCIKPEGAFYVMMNLEQLIGRTIHGVEITNDDVFADVFLKYGLVAVVPGSGFGAPNFVRWSYATSMGNIKEGLDRLEKFLAGE